MSYQKCQKIGYDRLCLLIELYEQNVDYSEIAKQIGVKGKSTVCRYLGVVGIPVKQLKLKPGTKTFLREEYAKRSKIQRDRFQALILPFEAGTAGDSNSGDSGEDQQKVRA